MEWWQFRIYMNFPIYDLSFLNRAGKYKSKYQFSLIYIDIYI